RPELTAEVFLPDPFRPAGRMYKTGDTARWMRGGILEFHGRSDNQVKLRGFRIELGEIEAVFAAHPGIRAAAVNIREETLIAWCEWRGTPVDAASLRKFVAARLPDYMAPARFVTLLALPRLPNGKVDRRALTTFAEPPELVRAVPPPADETERRIAAIWQELLGRASISAHDDFFDLGGHSLLAARAASRIGDAFGTHVPVSALFEAPTVALLAAHLRAGARPAWPPRVIPIQPSGSGIPFWVIGSGAAFREVAKHLRADQPVFGVLLEDCDVEKFTPPYNVESIAAEFTRLIRKQQPAGPYQIGGHSAFGLVALEVARQLGAAGEKVLFLALFDTPLPNGVRLRFPLSLRFRVHASKAWWLLARGRVLDSFAFILSAMQDVVVRLRPAESGGAAPAASIEQVLRLAAFAYEPQPYRGRIVFLQAAGQPIALQLGSRLGWPEYAIGDFDVRIVPGDHINMLAGSNSAAVAEVLTDVLARGDGP
ncbi:MAG TPA: thioesterase domain-containing protein, partial [Bryobacteraceae bacterium]|nr:thioesterase domain-containing protein [Bryobacteraceae bacterium]